MKNQITMKNLNFNLDSVEKERILEMHKNATNKLYLSENHHVVIEQTQFSINNLPQNVVTFIRDNTPKEGWDYWVNQLKQSGAETKGLNSLPGPLLQYAKSLPTDVFGVLVKNTPKEGWDNWVRRNIQSPAMSASTQNSTQTNTTPASSTGNTQFTDYYVKEAQKLLGFTGKDIDGKFGKNTFSRLKMLIDRSQNKPIEVSSLPVQSLPQPANTQQK